MSELEARLRTTKVNLGLDQVSSIHSKHISVLMRTLKHLLIQKEGTLYIACNDMKAFFTSTDHRG